MTIGPEMCAAFRQELCNFLLQDIRFSGNDQNLLCALGDIRPPAVRPSLIALTWLPGLTSTRS